MLEKSDARYRILYLDDEENELIIVKRNLESIDPELHVTIISSPEEALNIFESYHCIITDYRMSSMDGLEFSRKVRESSEIPIILYTALKTDELVRKAKALKIQECLSKGSEPNHYHTLVNLVRSTIE